jgi:hypothetical protein
MTDSHHSLFATQRSPRCPVPLNKTVSEKVKKQVAVKATRLVPILFMANRRSETSVAAKSAVITCRAASHSGAYNNTSRMPHTSSITPDLHFTFAAEREKAKPNADKNPTASPASTESPTGVRRKATIEETITYSLGMFAAITGLMLRSNYALATLLETLACLFLILEVLRTRRPHKR